MCYCILFSWVYLTFKYLFDFQKDFLQMAAASTVKVSINLPVPDPIILNNSSKNCDGDAKLPKKRKITTVDEHKSVNESGDMK